MQTKLIAFDMDGVLLDSMGELEDLAVYILTAYNIVKDPGIAREMYQSTVGIPFRQQLDNLDKRIHNIDADYRELLTRDESLDTIAESYENWHTSKASSFMLSPGVNKAFIESLGVPTVLVSSTERSLILEHIKVVQEIGLRHVGGLSKGNNKRQQLIGYTIAYDLMLPEVLFVGDTFRDKEIAEELGMQYLDVNPGNIVFRVTDYVA